MTSSSPLHLQSLNVSPFTLTVLTVYHLKCIDPWLTNNRRVCPVCKAKVLLPGVAEPNSDSDDNSHANERTPLVEPQRNRERAEQAFQRELVASLFRTPTSSPPRTHISSRGGNRRGYQTLEDNSTTAGAAVDRRPYGEGSSGISAADLERRRREIEVPRIRIRPNQRTRNRSYRHRRTDSESNRHLTDATANTTAADSSIQVTSEFERLLTTAATLAAAGRSIAEIQDDLNANPSVDAVQTAHVEAVIEIDGAAHDQPNTIDV